MFFDRLKSTVGLQQVGDSVYYTTFKYIKSDPTKMYMDTQALRIWFKYMDMWPGHKDIYYDKIIK